MFAAAATLLLSCSECMAQRALTAVCCCCCECKAQRAPSCMFTAAATTLLLLLYSTFTAATLQLLSRSHLLIMAYVTTR